MTKGKRSRPRKARKAAAEPKIQEVKPETPRTQPCIACQKSTKLISEGATWRRFYCEDCKIERVIVVEASD